MPQSATSPGAFHYGEAQIGKPTAARSSEPLVVMSELAVDVLSQRAQGHGDGHFLLHLASPLMTFQLSVEAREQTSSRDRTRSDL